MKGICYQNTDVELFFGCRPANIFLYNSISSASTVRGKRPRLYLRISRDAIDWLKLIDPAEIKAGDIACLSDYQPIFHLDLSDNLAVKDNITAILATARHRNIFTNPKLSDPFYIMPSCGYSNAFRLNDLTCGRLFADFLFDLGHGRIFDSCPDIGTIETRLLEHPIVNAIRDKGEFLWRKDEYLRIKSDEGLLCVRNARNYVEAEMEWLDTCLAKGADDLFLQGGEWFYNPHSEVQRIIYTKSDEAVTGYASFWHRVVKFRERLHERIVKTGEVATLGKRMRCCHIELTSWLLRRYDLDGAFNALFLNLSKGSGKYLPCVINSFVIFLYFLAIVLTLPTPRHFSANYLNWILLPSVLLGVMIWLWPRLIGKSSYVISNNSSEDNTSVPVPLRPVSCALCFSILFILMVFIAGEVGLWHGSWKWIVLLSLLFSGPGILLIVFGLFLMVLPYPIYGKKPRTLVTLIRMMLPRLFFAIAGTWMMTVIVEEVWNTTLFVSAGTGTCRILCIVFVSYLFVIAKVNRRVPNFVSSAWRSACIVGLAFVISLYIGIIAMGFQGQKIIRHSGILTDTYSAEILKRLAEKSPDSSGVRAAVHAKDAGQIYKDLNSIRVGYIDMRIMYSFPGNTVLPEFQIYPWTLLYRSCLVMFITFFLQMIFEDREITEPL